ncbi:MAG: hypothetical protein ABJB05_12085 [Parafilimonas sp.]
MENNNLTTREAYIAMIFFLEDTLTRIKSDDLAGLLGDLSINNDDNKPMDPAMWKDWLNAVQKTLQSSK